MSNTVTICDSSNQILAGLLSGDVSFRPNVMYVEFQSGSEPVTVPEPKPSDNHGKYFLDMRENTHSERDFIRIPIVSVTPVAAQGSNDIIVYFNGICTGATGVGGKSTLNSRIYGISLANSPTYGKEIDDLTRDIVWARGYFDTANQMQFSSVAQTIVTFKLNLTT